MEKKEKKVFFLFAHDRIKDAFYKKCGEDKRKFLHREIAKTMEEMNKNNKEKVIFDLAYHYIEGEVEDKILEYAYPAGIKAKENYAYEEAYSYLSKAAIILEKRNEKEKLQECMELIGEIYMTIGKNEQAISIFDSLIKQKENLIDRASLYRKISQTYFNKGDYENCEKYGALGLKELRENLPVKGFSLALGIIKELIIHILLSMFPYSFFYKRKKLKLQDRFKQIIWSYYPLAWTYIFTDLRKFLRVILRMLNISRLKLGISKELGLSVAAYASLLMALAMFKASIKNHERALELRRKINDIWGVGESLQFMGVCYQWKGDYQKSIDCFIEGIDTLKKTGDIKEILMSLTNLALDYNYISNYEKQEEVEDQIYELALRMNDNYSLTETFQRSGIILLERGQYDKAKELLQKSYQYAKTYGFKMPLCEIGIYLSEIALEQRDMKKAFEYLEGSKKLYETNNFMKQYIVLLYYRLTELYIAEYKRRRDLLTSEQKKGYIIKISTSLKKALKETKNWSIHYGGALRAAGVYYSLINKSKKSEKCFIKVCELYNKAGVKYELGKCNYEYGLFLKNLGRTEEAKKNLESAYLIFKEIGARGYLEKVSRELGITELTEGDSSGSIYRLKNKERLSTIIKVSQTISSILNIDTLLKSVVSLAMEVTGAQRGYLFIQEGNSELLLKIKKSINEKEEFAEGEKYYSKNIVENVFRTGKAIITNNAEREEKYSLLRLIVPLFHILYGKKNYLGILRVLLPMRRLAEKGALQQRARELYFLMK